MPYLSDADLPLELSERSSDLVVTERATGDVVFTVPLPTVSGHHDIAALMVMREAASGATYVDLPTSRTC